MPCPFHGRQREQISVRLFAPVCGSGMLGGVPQRCHFFHDLLVNFGAFTRFLRYSDKYRNFHNTRNRKRCMSVDEARVVCKDRNVWRSGLSAYPERDLA